MLLKNYYDFLHGCHINTQATLRNYNGSTTNVSPAYANSAINFKNILSGLAASAVVGRVIVGTGDEPPKFDDYKLSGSIISTISGQGNVTVTNDDDGMEYRSLITITNTSATDEITIKEIGATIGNSATGLLDRTVLDSPLIIPPGGVGQVTYTIRMNYPTA